MRHIIVLCIMVLAIPFLVQADTLEFVFSDFPPFEYIENNSPAGINIEIIAEACRRLGVTPIFRQLPWKRALVYAKNGQTDAVFSLFKNPKRMAFFDYPRENLNAVKIVPVTIRENTMSLTCLEDLRGKVVGVYRGSSYGKTFDSAVWIRKEMADTNESLLKKLVTGRTDLIVMDEYVAGYWTKKLDLSGRFRILPFSITTNKTYVAFSKNRAAQTGVYWAEKFSTALKELRQEGFIDRLEIKYQL